jgi:hypothetical protein
MHEDTPIMAFVRIKVETTIQARAKPTFLTENEEARMMHRWTLVLSVAHPTAHGHSFTQVGRAKPQENVESGCDLVSVVVGILFRHITSSSLLTKYKNYVL